MYKRDACTVANPKKGPYCCQTLESILARSIVSCSSRVLKPDMRGAKSRLTSQPGRRADGRQQGSRS